MMQCMICRQGETKVGRTTVTLEREGMTLVIKDVPARICTTCGETYVDEDTGAELLELADEASRSGVQVDVRHYRAA